MVSRKELKSVYAPDSVMKLPTKKPPLEFPCFEASSSVFSLKYIRIFLGKMMIWISQVQSQIIPIKTIQISYPLWKGGSWSTAWDNFNLEKLIKIRICTPQNVLLNCRIRNTVRSWLL